MWSKGLEILVRGKGLWSSVSPSSYVSETSSGAQRQSDERKQVLALAFKMMSIDGSCKLRLITMRDSAAHWNTVKKLYSAISEAAKLAILTRP